MRRLAAGFWLLVGCGASVPAETHRSALAEQRTAYEGRLFDAERTRLACMADAHRARSAADADRASLELRVARLERASARACRPVRPVAGAGPLSTLLRRALGERAQVVASGRNARWTVPLDAWFDAGAWRPRAGAVESLGRLAALMARRADLRVTVSTARPPPGPKAGPDATLEWREAAERAMALMSVLQQQGIAAARLTLTVGGEAPEGRIVFIIEQARRRGRR